MKAMKERLWPVPQGWAIGLMVSYTLLCPLVLLGLFWLQGLPGVALSHPLTFLLWVFSDTWLASIVSGAALAWGTRFLIQRTGYFHQPFDVGRSFSMGAIGGALAQAGGLWLHFLVLFHHAPTAYRTAGNIIAGCISGAIICWLFIWRLSIQKVPFKTAI